MEFRPHELFKEHPIQHADIYFFRFISRNWSDKYTAQILERLVPTMKNGLRVITYEFLPDEIAITSWTQKQKRFVFIFPTTRGDENV